MAREKSPQEIAAAEEKLLSAYEISSEKPAEKKLIYARVTRDEVERF